MIDTKIEKAISILENNTLRNIILLKHAFQLQNTAKYVSWDNFVGMQFKPQSMQHDRKLYPDYKTVNILSSDNVVDVNKYIELVPAGKNIVKIQGCINDNIDFTLLRSFQSLTINHSILKEVQNKIHHESLFNINKYKTLFRIINYTIQDIEELINNCGALILSIKDQDEPVASCVVYQVYKNIWEIGALSTLAEYRRKHLAEDLIIYATNLLISRQQIPRYHVNIENLASLNLAIKCGYTKFIDLNHYQYEKRINSGGY